MSPILECIPNFSEGKDQSVIDAIAAEISAVSQVALLHVDTSAAANRTVMTFAGEPEAVTEAAFRAMRKAAALIDMRQQAGVHPRIGATDVCPLVPLYGIDMAEADTLAQQLAARVGAELQVPVYLYEHSQPRAYRRALPDIRKGQYEGLATRMQQPEWQPDYGPANLDTHAGATVLGARKILVAFNISLATADIELAHAIARQIRSSGYTRTVSGQKEKIPGLLPALRAIGWYMADYGQAQVSFNLLDYTVTSPLQVWRSCRQLAEDAGVALAGSEVIGLIPEQCLLEAGAYALGVTATDSDKKRLITAAIELLGLDRLKAFNPDEKVLEYALAAKGLL